MVSFQDARDEAMEDDEAMEARSIEVKKSKKTTSRYRGENIEERRKRRENHY